MVDKIEQFAAELANPATDLEGQFWLSSFFCTSSATCISRCTALDDNEKKVSATGIKTGNLHHCWDTDFVALLETDAKSIASDLIGHISKEQEKAWQVGSPSDWAKGSFQIAKADGSAVEQGRGAPYVRAEQRGSKAIDCLG